MAVYGQRGRDTWEVVASKMKLLAEPEESTHNAVASI